MGSSIIGVTIYSGLWIFYTLEDRSQKDENLQPEIPPCEPSPSAHPQAGSPPRGNPSRDQEIELRTKRVSDAIIGQRFYIYAAMKFPSPGDVRKYCKLRWKEGDLPTGIIVGTAIISKCVRGGNIRIASDRREAAEATDQAQEPSAAIVVLSILMTNLMVVTGRSIQENRRRKNLSFFS